MSDKNGGSGAKPDVDALRAEIKQTRAELGETVQALAAKADVKARAKEQVEQTKAKAKAQVHEATEKVRGAAANAAAVASDKVRAVTSQTGDKVAPALDKVRETGALDKAHEAREQVRRNPVPFAAVLAAGVALVGIILIVRGRRK
jgi:cobalamin biosynthesis Mg chelatase CobN